VANNNARLCYAAQVCARSTLHSAQILEVALGATRAHNGDETRLASRLLRSMCVSVFKACERDQATVRSGGKGLRDDDDFSFRSLPSLSLPRSPRTRFSPSSLVSFLSAREQERRKRPLDEQIQSHSNTEMKLDTFSFPNDDYP